ncbi:unnamed protein product [Cylicocyclus nassatus]|uniref:Metalloendopeptidase n=1 Tax=Cylicocyclus nassatus TaxID=53992 RepID=A0AA36GRK6_CYLNA|nr:unnamed protein product [Cylicocyclus nassatus]
MSALCYLFVLSFVKSATGAAAAIPTRDVIDKSKPDAETVLSEADFQIYSLVKDVTKIGIKVKDDPTMGNKMEGDIAIDDIKKFIEDSNKLGRSAIRQAYRRWPNAEIPYTLSSQYGSYSRSVIARAMQEYHDKTCVRFVPRDPSRHVDYIHIHPDDGCYSLVGKTGGRQPLSLDSGCIQVGTIVHELMHAVGFFHEQSRNHVLTTIGDAHFGHYLRTVKIMKKSSILYVRSLVAHVNRGNLGTKLFQSGGMDELRAMLRRSSQEHSGIHRLAQNAETAASHFLEEEKATTII